MAVPSSTIGSPVASSFSSFFQSRQQKKMSITQTYYLAHTARKKLTREASRADHDLRLLVGHANLLDSLMIDLADAEQEQERWFNQTVNGARQTSEEKPRHIQWASTVVEEEVLEDDSDSDEDDSDFDESEFVINTPIRRRPISPPLPEPILEEDDDDTDSDFEYDEGEELALTRSPSRQIPELLADSDDESEDEGMPPSPPTTTLESFDPKESTSTAIPLDDQDRMFEPGYYVSQETSPIIEAF
ncbi:hypothetical protein N7495_000121 [Penicillium taxi]|uniref:uncharacterized protein n=1 Tax=Penicillium taxi TaxID=168475 RepID=UPI0025458E33|nr:uncharacterized protein N7495_000121 [Penicillium taxi]KAJ5907439.1 hypothetical protein N7495_000121 [Penicillium taxi]